MSATTVRDQALWVVERVLASRAPLDSFLASAQRQCAPRDHGLLHELAAGTLRWLRRLDHVIAVAADRGLDRIDVELLGVLRLAVYQLLFLDRVPAHAAVDEAVKMARARSHRGGVGFVNAVLRRVSRRPSLESWPVEIDGTAARLAVEWSHPTVLVETWLERLGVASTEQLLAANNRPRPTHLLSFEDRGGRAELARRLAEEGCEVSPSRLSPQGLRVHKGSPLSGPAFTEGLFYVQDEASQAAALIPPPVPGERVLDLAAAPGGKGFALLAAEPRVALTMADVSLARQQTTRRNLERLRRSVPLAVADGGVPAFADRFDRVVVDLPCSGTGTLRKHPELKWRFSAPELERLAANGRRILSAAARAVRPGGILVAITCSLEIEENEAVVDAILDSSTDLERVGLLRELPPELAAHLDGRGVWRLWPADDHDGFTVQVLRRRSVP